MKRSRALSWTAGVLVGLGVILATWAMPTPANAGGVHLSIGIGVSTPVYVAPLLLVVRPAPVIVQPAPRVVYPGVVYPPPVAYTAPCDVYGRPLPPGLAKKHHGYYPGYYPAYGYKFYKHGRPGW